MSDNVYYVKSMEGHRQDVDVEETCDWNHKFAVLYALCFQSPAMRPGSPSILTDFKKTGGIDPAMGQRLDLCEVAARLHTRFVHLRSNICASDAVHFFARRTSESVVCSLLFMLSRVFRSLVVLHIKLHRFQIDRNRAHNKRIMTDNL